MNSDKINNYLEDRRPPKSKSKKVYKSFVQLEDGKIAEEILNPDPAFAIYDPVTELIEVKPTVQINGKYIYPLDGDLITKKVVLFPEKAEEYSSLEELRQGITTFIHRYVDIHPFYEKIASYYVLLTWLFDKNTVITYLGIYGDYGSGKTRAAQVIGNLCYKPAPVSGALTCAPIYRLLDQARGTLIINEFDFDNSDMGIELIKILNNGYEKGMHVLRVEGKTGKVEAFDAFSPKIFTYRKKKKDLAFESRLITIPMEETKREDISVLLPLEYEREALQIRNKLLMFRFKNFHKKVLVDESIFQGVERRLRQTLYPLLTVVDDSEFIKTLGKFIQDLQQQQQTERGMSWVADYLISLIELTKTEEEITVKALTDQYNQGKIGKEIVSARRVGHVVREDFKLKTGRLTSGKYKGLFGVRIDVGKIKALCLRYGIEIPEQSSLHSLSSPQDQLYSEDGEHREYKEDSKEITKEVIESCFACGSTEFWRRHDGGIVCKTCHPPVSDEDVKEWIAV